MDEWMDDGVHAAHVFHGGGCWIFSFATCSLCSMCALCSPSYEGAVPVSGCVWGGGGGAGSIVWVCYGQGE